MGSNGSNPHPITTGASEYGHPSWSPDGTRLAFTRGSGSRTNEIYLLSLAGSRLLQVTTGASNDEAAWEMHNTAPLPPLPPPPTLGPNALVLCDRFYHPPSTFTQRLYAMHAPCAAADAVWRRYVKVRTHLPASAFTVPYGHDGRPFRLGRYRCRYRPTGLAGGEFQMHCRNQRRLVLAQGEQDAA
jgi:hypothetical protein